MLADQPTVLMKPHRHCHPMQVCASLPCWGLLAACRADLGRCAGADSSQPGSALGSSQPPCEVFINHTGADCGQQAGWLKRELQLNGLNAFLDESGGPQAGEPWPDVLQQAARSCRVFIALISPHYFQRDWPVRELRIALDRLKAQRQQQPGTAALTVIPVCVWNRQQAAAAAVSAANDEAQHMMDQLAQLQNPNVQRIYQEHYKLMEVKLVEELVRAALYVLPRHEFEVPPGEQMFVHCWNLL